MLSRTWIVAALSTPLGAFAQDVLPAVSGDGSSQATLAWGDFDGDGLNDVFAVRPGQPGSLLRNRGDGRFEDATRAAGLSKGHAAVARWADYDGDGHLDLFLGASAGASSLWRNLGDGTFHESSAQAGLDLVEGVLDAAWLDYDSDGRADLYVHGAERRELFHNAGNGLFQCAELNLPAMGAATTWLSASTMPGSAAPIAPGFDRADEQASRGGSFDLAVTNTGRGPSGVAALGTGFCADALVDQAGGSSCISASSVPTSGMLYPLGFLFNIDSATGHVSMGGDPDPSTHLQVRKIGSGDLFKLFEVNTPVFSVVDGGSVGIGTDTPLGKLDVRQNDAADILNLLDSGVIRLTVKDGGDTCIGSSVPDGKLSVRLGNAIPKDIFNLYDGFTNVMTVVDDGNVGIGETAPESKLHIAGPDDGIDGPTLRFSGDVDNPFEGGRIRMTEFDTLMGGYVHYDAGSNRLNIGTHTLANQSVSDDVDAITINRTSEVQVGIGTAPSNSALLNVVETDSDDAIRAQNSVGSAGVFLASGSGFGVFGQNTGSGTAAFFQTTSTTSSLPTVQVLASGPGEGIEVVQSGSGPSIVANNTSNNGNIITANNGSDIEFRVHSSGDVFCDGAFIDTGADYAEWLERADLEEDIGPGDVVGLRGGKISKSLDGAHDVMVVSTNPALVGNAANAEERVRDGFEIVAFVGQAPVKVRGSVRVGDFLVPSGFDDGTAVAVAPDAIALEQLDTVLGVAWEQDERETLKLVNTAVGVDQASAAKAVIASLQSRVRESEARFEARLAALADRVGRLESAPVAGP